MNNPDPEKNLRLLVIDDNRAIHNDFRKILCAKQDEDAGLDAEEAALFGESGAGKRIPFQIDSAFQGQEGLAMVEQALRNGSPYAMAFIDVRMPPGWDGIETTSRIWAIDPDLQVVICTAYSDYSWDELIRKVGNSDRLLILKKPFDAVEVLQLANALTEKWRLQQAAKSRLDLLEEALQARTRDLQTTNTRLQAEIVERSRAADSLTEQAALLQLAHDAIFVRDLAGSIQFWNKGAEDLYGWTAGEAAGASIAQLLSPDALAFQAAEKILFEKGEWSGEHRKHTKAGKEVIVDSRWTLLRDKEGKPRSVLMINTDVTEKKRLEAQFLRSQRMEGIGTLATGMAHDLNNILAPILMSAGIMRYELSTQEREMAIDRIEQSVKRGADIIQQVLTFGRGVSGERVVVNPMEVVRDLSGIISQTFPKNITLVEDPNAIVWPILGDKTQIHQVLMNLAINARDAMPEGGTLSLLAKNIMVNEADAILHAPLQPGPYVELQVADTGSGIPASDLERIFDPFFTTKEFGKGTGLGLSTVLGIVKSHGGLVTVDSELNRRTTFKVLLPASPNSLKGRLPANTSGLPHGKGEVILIVDDEDNIISATGRMLEQFGYKVLEANDGREALAIISHTGRVDLVLTDIMMGQMDGMALIQELRARHPEIKIIASSGLVTNLRGDLQQEELKSLWVKSCLTKPYSPEKLLTLLHEEFQEKKDDVVCL